MTVKATQKYTRQTPRKLRLVAQSIKGMPLPVAIEHLGSMQRKASIAVLKVLRQAIANAMHNHGTALADLSLKTIVVSEGPIYRRFQAVSRGRAHSIQKKSSHVMVELQSSSDVTPVEKPVVEKKATSTKKPTSTKKSTSTKKPATAKK